MFSAGGLGVLCSYQQLHLTNARGGEVGRIFTNCGEGVRRKTKELWGNKKGDGRQDCLRDLAAWGGAFAYQLLLAMEMVSDPFPLQAACLMLAEEPHGACTPGL